MQHWRLAINLAKCLITSLSIILMVSAKVNQGSSCQNRLDLAIAVDTTSSLSSSDFDHVKAEVKVIVSAFTIGPDNIRLALIGMSKRAAVVLNFNAVNSLSDFNAAVDSLTFSTDIVDLSEGIKVAKESVLSTARTFLTSRILLLVKDRRAGSSIVAGASELTRVTSETAAVKALGAVVNAVGVGGLWNSLELTALFGKDYLLLKGKNSALESVKSLNNRRCISPCPNNGTSSQRFGDCFGSHRLSVSTGVELAVNSAGNGVCRKTVRKDILPCSGTSDRCFKLEQKYEACGAASQQLRVSQVRHFAPTLERCVATRLLSTADTCGSDSSQNCLDREVDLVVLMDMSGPFSSNDIKGLVDLVVGVATMLTKRTKAVRSLPTRVVTFNSRSVREWGLYIHHIYKIELVIIDFKNAMGEVAGKPLTSAAIDMAVQLLKQHGRKDSYRQVILLSHLPSADPEKTQRSAMLAKSAGISIVTFGVGDKVSASELRDLASPDVDAGKLVYSNYKELNDFVNSVFVPTYCFIISNPASELCHNATHLQTVSNCVGNTQHQTRVSFSFDSTKSCQKQVSSGVTPKCHEKCIDPIDGNDYSWTAAWTSGCHDFTCDGAGAQQLKWRTAKCLALDGTCKAIGSSSFACRDEAGVESSTCHCVDIAGRATLLVDT